MPTIANTGPIVIAGGSGFLGISLATHLAALGKSVVLLSRSPPKVKGPWRHATWDGAVSESGATSWPGRAAWSTW